MKWRELYEKRDWNELENWFRWEEDLSEVAAFREQLRADVPRIMHKNGVEDVEDFVTPDEAPPEWRGAAEIIQRGELDAMVDGEPKSVPTEWKTFTLRLRAELSAYQEANEVTEGSDRLSRREHATRSLVALDGVEFLILAMSGEADRSGADAEEKQWLRECMEEAAAKGFEAGYHMRAAEGKVHENAALKTYKMIEDNRSHGARGGQGEKKKLRYEYLDALAKQNLQAFNMSSDGERLKMARSWAVDHDRGADVKLFTQQGHILSDNWFKNWVSDFLSQQKFLLSKTTT